MSRLLILATAAITLALVFYTIGVWSERRAKTLKGWHVATFWLGLAFDTTGTLMMGRIAEAGSAPASALSSGIHGATGALAIVLMIFHALWATFVLRRNDERQKASFHRLSIVVWCVWLVPYLLGMVLGMLE